MKKSEQVIKDIATKHLSMITLEGRGADDLDFHLLSVWSIKNALQAAFNAGRDQHAQSHIRTYPMTMADGRRVRVTVPVD